MDGENELKIDYQIQTPNLPTISNKRDVIKIIMPQRSDLSRQSDNPVFSDDKQL